MTTLDEFVAMCEAMLGEADVGQRIAEAMRPLVADPAELSPAIEDLRPEPGRPAVVHRSDELTVLGLEVAAGFVSPPHDHRLWAVVGIYQGAEDNVFYRRGPDGIEETGRAVLEEGDCLAFPPDAVHGIANSGTAPMRGLHVYGGDLFATERSTWDPISGEEQPFA
jgi:predicted metal-dependent enzyme (double-stranded beta helix superfamily)